MDENLEEFVRETYVVEEIDLDYEFDAPRFYDFSRPETDCGAREAQCWFESAGSYPPSPFIIKLNWHKGFPMEVVKNKSAKSEDVEDLNANNRGLDNHITKDISQAKIKSSLKSTLSRSSTLMKPTASHLAKQNQLQLVHSIQSLRLQKKLGNIDTKSSQNSSVTDDLATKRQKLEGGYLSKAAQLNQQAFLLHKVPKKLNSFSANPKSKATIPREPDLETARRAERRRCNNNAELSEPTKPNAYNFKAHPLNRKILQPISLPLSRREPQLLEFQVFHLKKSERAIQSANAEEKSSNLVNGLSKEKRERVYNFGACSPSKKAINFSTNGRFLDEPPIHLFSQLCITSEAQENRKPGSKTPLSTKGTRKKIPGSFAKEHELYRQITTIGTQ